MRDLFLLDPDVVFLNHGSYGACPRPVFEEYQRLQRELERNPVEFLGRDRRWPGLMAAATAELAAFVGADPRDVVPMANATTGINVVARSLRLEPGDEIVVTDHEYGAIELLWRIVCDRAGARAVPCAVPVPLDPGRVIETLLAAVTPRTRAAVFSHVTSPTALVFPVAELCRELRARGVLSIVDGAHAPGQIPLDLEAIGADFYAGNGAGAVVEPGGEDAPRDRQRPAPLPLPPRAGGQAREGGGRGGVPERVADEPVRHPTRRARRSDRRPGRTRTRRSRPSDETRWKATARSRSTTAGA